MALDPHAQRLLSMVAAGRGLAAPPSSPGVRRRALADLMRLAAPGPTNLMVEDLPVPGPRGPLPVRLYTPPKVAAPLPALVYFHGGGGVAGSLDTHDPLCRTLCAAIGCKVMAIDYALAPEHPFPAAIEDALAGATHIFRYAAALGIDPARIALAGDSAGATLAVVVARDRRDAPGDKPRALLLLCPVLDASAKTDSREAFAEGFLLDRALMARDLVDYAPGHPDLADPRLSPLRAPDVARFPETMIHVAEFDPVRDEGAAYADRLARAGVPVRLHRHAGMVHHFYGLTGVIPRARVILDAIAAEMREVFARPGPDHITAQSR